MVLFWRDRQDGDAIPIEEEKFDRQRPFSSFHYFICLSPYVGVSEDDDDCQHGADCEGDESEFDAVVDKAGELDCNGFRGALHVSMIPASRWASFISRSRAVKMGHARPRPRLALFHSRLASY